MNIKLPTRFKKTKKSFCKQLLLLFVALISILSQAQNLQGNVAVGSYIEETTFESSLKYTNQLIKEKSLHIHNVTYANTRYFSSVVTEVMKRYRSGKETNISNLEVLIQEKILSKYTELNELSVAMLTDKVKVEKKPKITIRERSQNNGPLCDNIGFEDQNLSNWTQVIGENTGAQIFDFQNPVNHQTFDYVNQSCNNDFEYGIDYFGDEYFITLDGSQTTCLNETTVFDGDHSLLMGNYSGGSNVVAAYRDFTVDNTTSFLEIFFTVALENPNHVIEAQPYFLINILDDQDQELDCLKFSAIAGDDQPGWTSIGDVEVLPWQSRVLPLDAYIGQTLTLQVIIADCAYSAHFAQAIVDFRCSNEGVGLTYSDGCSGFPATLTAPDGEAWFWNTGETTQDIVINGPGTYDVTITPFNADPTCSGYNVSIEVDNDNCSSTIDFDGVDDHIIATEILGGNAAASQMAWVRLNSDFGQSYNGNAQLVSGGQDPNNVVGPILNPGTVADNTNSGQLNYSDDTMNVYLEHTVPAGTDITLSVANSNYNSTDIQVSDGVNSQIIAVSGTQNEIKHIIYTTTQQTSLLTLTRDFGITWVDGVSYELTGSPGYVTGQSNNKLWIEPDGKLSGSIVTDNGTFTLTSNDQLTNNVWGHVASTYDGTNYKLFINGEESASINATGNLVVDNGNYEIGRDPETSSNYIHAFIDDVRVYDVALTNAQLQAQVYQEITINGANIIGATVPKEITGLPANTLQLYYKMDPVSLGKVIDQSTFGRDGTLYNITTVQEQNAPMPYVANASGAWTNEATWEFGAYWDIEDVPNKDWSIVHITDNAEVTTVDNHTQLGLLIDNGAKLTVNNDSGLFNTSYLKLDGVLDLQGESQLIQTQTSDLDISSQGYLERDQQGKSDLFSYNYWSSPVGTINASSNNNDYTVASILKDGTNAANPSNISFTTEYDGAPTTPITLSNFWIYTYENQPDDYLNWVQLLETGNIAVGQGYTMKGPGSGGTENNQNYTFLGKPNNGDIDHNIAANNLSLLGNPYPSALDADQFILDNLAVIDEDGDVINAGITTGALYFWEHFSTNNTHIFSQYEGGYATYNLTGATIAVPDPDVSSNGVGSKLPKRYIPVAQGFFVQGGEGGTISFNNGQRAFEKESGDDSIFTFSSDDNDDASTTSPPRPDIDRLYFRITLPQGNQRQLLLGVKDGTSLGIDFGYDAKMLELTNTDIAWEVENEPYVIQAIDKIQNDTEIPIYIRAGETGNMEISIEELQGVAADLPIYLLDKQEDLYTNLRLTNGNIDIQANTNYSGRFFIVFQEPSLSNDDVSIIQDNLNAFYLDGNMIINNSTVFNAKDIKLFNMLGQLVVHHPNVYEQVNHIEIPMTALSQGVYIIQFNYNDDIKISKQIIIK